jgi:hypothetical protein
MNQKEIVIYINSQATSVEGTQGFIKGYPNGPYFKKRKGGLYKQILTTMEYAFAFRFNSEIEAIKFNNKHKLPGIILSRITD